MARKRIKRSGISLPRNIEQGAAPILENIRSRKYTTHRPYICKVRYSARYNASRNIARRRRIRRKGFYRRVL